MINFNQIFCAKFLFPGIPPAKPSHVNFRFLDHSPSAIAVQLGRRGFAVLAPNPVLPNISFQHHRHSMSWIAC